MLVRFVALILLGFVTMHADTSHAAPETADPAYVSSAVCAECHQKEHASWSTSHHGWALRLPSPDTVLGDFNEATFDHEGTRWRFFKRNGRFFIESDGQNSKPEEFQIEYTVGVEPLQQYLVKTRDGRLQALDLAWDTAKRRWYHLYPDDITDVGNGPHWTGP